MSKTVVVIFGVIFLLIGLAGFVGNPLIGANALFETNSATNWLHIIAGVLLLAAGYMAKQANTPFSTPVIRPPAPPPGRI